MGCNLIEMSPVPHIMVAKVMIGCLYNGALINYDDKKTLGYFANLF